MIKKIFSAFIVLILFLSNINAQYNIKLTIPQLKNQEIILGHHFATMLIPDDTVKLNSKGTGIFKDKESLKQGIYFFFLPNKKTFDIIIGKDQNFSIHTDTTDLQNKIKVEGDRENLVFAEYQRFLTAKRKIAQELTEKRKTAEGEEKKKIDEQLKQLNKEVRKEIEGIIAKAPNDFFSKFLKATLEIEVPDSIKDRTQRYYYYRDHYFDYFDYKDARLLRSPIYENKIDFFLDKLLLQAPDTIIRYVDMLIDGSRGDKELFRYMLVHLFNKYAKSELMGMENVYVHIAEKYYIPDAYWSDPEFISELKRKVERKKQALIGMNAPEIKMITLPADPADIEALRDQLENLRAKGDEFLADKNAIEREKKELMMNYPDYSDSAAVEQAKINHLAAILNDEYIPLFEGYTSLHQIDTKYLILWFWEPDCSHCQKMTPILVNLYNEQKLREKGVTVMAIYLHRNINEWHKYTDHIKKWYDFVLEHNMDIFINVWEPFGISHFRDKYDISSTPVLYLLDKDKKIIAKRISPEQAVNIINDLEKNNK
jgi:thiol-disulfide isomerase/thioredoxin